MTATKHIEFLGRVPAELLNEAQAHRVHAMRLLQASPLGAAETKAQAEHDVSTMVRLLTLGAGAWRKPPVWSIATESQPATGRERAGVLGWQRALVGHGYSECPRNRQYDDATAAAVAHFQRDRGYLQLGPDDGIIGVRTGKSIVRPYAQFFETQTTPRIPFGYLMGLVLNESLWDTGAQGYLTPTDYGCVQINISAHPDITVTQACDPMFAVPWAANRMAAAFTSLGTWEAAILSHRSPGWAKYLVEHGEYPNDEARKYVTRIMAGG